MAKRKKKSATALFEVMSAGKSLELPVVRNRPLIQAPSFWQRWQQKRALTAEARANRPEPIIAGEPEPARVELSPIEAARLEFKAEAEAAAQREPVAAASEPSESNSGGGTLPFKIDFTTGVIIVSGLVCFVGLTFLISQKIGNPSRPPALAATQVTKTPVRPSVMEITPRQPVIQQQAEQRPPVVEQSPASSNQRVINQNYVVIQSFPDEKLAKEAAELLNKHGVGCTVVQGLARWTNRMQWYSIVGTKGFSPRSAGTPEYEEYITRIEDVSVIFAGRSKWKRFEPKSYRWGADSEK